MTLSPASTAQAPAEPLAAALLSLIELTGTGLTVKDVASGRYEQINTVAEGILGLTAHDLLGRVDADVFSPSQAMALRAADQQTLAQRGEPSRAEHRLERPDGSRHDCNVVRTVVADAAGNPRWVVGLWTDISNERKREAQLQAALAQLEQQQQANNNLRREMADHHVRDEATGLYQRMHFEEQLHRESDLSAREHREFALVTISIDGIEAFAAQHGDAARDRVIEALGRLLRANTRAMDSPCRLGHDRFAILLSGVGLATAHARMEGLRRQCAEHIVALSGQQLNFTVSMGVASYPHTAGTVEQLLRSSELALAQARERGGNRVVLASIQFEMT